MDKCIYHVQNKIYKLIGICIAFLLANCVTGFAADATYINQSVFNDTIGPAAIYTTDIGSLSGAETFYISVQSNSIYPWELTVYKKALNGSRVIWISNQCLGTLNAVENNIENAVSMVQKSSLVRSLANDSGLLPINSSNERMLDASGNSSNKTDACAIKTKLKNDGYYELQLRSISRVEPGVEFIVAEVGSDKIIPPIKWQLLVIKSTKASAIADELRKKADVLRSLGKNDEAIQEYDNATKINSQDYLAWKNKGLTLYSQEKYDEAIEAFDEAIRVNQNSVEAWHNKGLAFYSQGKYDEAIKAFDEAIRLDPKFAESWTYKGLAYSQKKYSEAVKIF
jgi:tetratricopeptide (TPR) repeat protein